VTTLLDETVIVEANGLTYVCSYCVPRARLLELGRTYRVSHGICTPCTARFEAGATA